jgi:S-adenosylmethionine:tRNA ribosyltransferase-isomerase
LTCVADAGRMTGDLALADFDYDLPPELIAQRPLQDRAGSRLLVVDRASGSLHHSSVRELGAWLAAGDLLVANNSRVFPARLHGRRYPGGGAVEILLLRVDDGVWSALARPAKRLRRGMRLEFTSVNAEMAPAWAAVEENLGEGHVRLRFDDGAEERLDSFGETPLPPYIVEPLADSERYQTVYASAPGSAAAPTAGLHFTQELIAGLRRQGIEWAEVTLHVGLDTFRPVTESQISNHRIHREWFQAPAATVEAIAACQERGGRVVAVGTTTARTLETLGGSSSLDSGHGLTAMTDLFIVPGHEWRVVDALLTNFHLPRSTLLMLVSALAGRETILAAYAEAIRERYRFYSFGDAMLIR